MNQTIKRIGSIFCAILLFLGLPLTEQIYGSAQATTCTDVSFESDWQIDANNKVKVSVFFENVVDTLNWDIVIRYDPSVIRIDAPGDFHCNVDEFDKNMEEANGIELDIFFSSVDVGDSGSVNYHVGFSSFWWNVYKTNIESNDDYPIDFDHFEAAVISFTVVDRQKFNAGDFVILAMGFADDHFIDSNPSVGDPVLVSGYCGDNADWQLKRNGVLSITGIGDMYNYNNRNSPWYKYKTMIKTVEIANGITSIGTCAFEDLIAVARIAIPQSVATIGDSAFSHCDSLREVTIPTAVTSIGNYAFYGCSSLSKITILNPECQLYNSADVIYGNATIEGYENSTAKSYARQYGRTFLSLGIYVPPVCDHEYEKAVTAPTCTEKGYTTYTCHCGESYVTDYVDAKGHSYVTEVTKKPTHFDAGEVTQSCSCGYSYKTPIDKLPDHTYEKTVISPTCTEKGYTIFVCVCGHNYIGDYVDAAHTYTKTVVAPTLVEKGYTIYSCKCGYAYVSDETVPAATDKVAFKNNVLVGLADTAVQNVLPYSGVETVIKDKDGNIKEADSKIVTGDKLVLENGDEIQIAVLGDINGDGVVATADARLVLRQAVNLESFSAVQVAAANVDGAPVISVSHARQVLRASVGLENASHWFGNLVK